MNRRRFLKLAGGSTAALATPAILSSCFGTAGGGGGKTLKLLMWSHFVPAYDTWFAKYAKDWGSKHNVSVTVDHVPTNTVITHASSEVASGSGHDLTLLQVDTHVAIFKDHVIDVTSLADKIAGKHGGWIPLAQFANFDGTWKAIPDFYIPYAGLYRKDLYDANGLSPSDTWDDLLQAGAKLKGKGHPAGMAISSTGDANASMYSVLWSFGGTFVGKDGHTITIRSAETKAAIDYMVKLYQQAMTNQVLSWDDSSNNRYLDSGVASWIHNPISAYRSASKDIQSKTYISDTPKGPAGRLMNAFPYNWVIWKWSKVQDVAQQFLSDYFDNWKQAFTASTGYNMPLLKDFNRKPMPILGSDPKLKIMQDLYSSVRGSAWPGPTTQAAGQVNATYVIPTMFAKACQGQSPEAAMDWAEQQLSTIYKKYPVS